MVELLKVPVTKDCLTEAALDVLRNDDGFRNILSEDEDPSDFDSLTVEHRVLCMERGFGAKLREMVVKAIDHYMIGRDGFLGEYHADKISSAVNEIGMNAVDYNYFQLDSSQKKELAGNQQFGSFDPFANTPEITGTPLTVKAQVKGFELQIVIDGAQNIRKDIKEVFDKSSDNPSIEDLLAMFEEPDGGKSEEIGNSDLGGLGFSVIRTVLPILKYDPEEGDPHQLVFAADFLHIIELEPGKINNESESESEDSIDSENL